jgi:hypothetical protein
MEAVKDQNGVIPKRRKSVRTPEGMLKNFLMRVIGPRKLKNLYERLEPADQAKLIATILPFVQSRKAAEPFSEEEIDQLHALMEEKADEKASPNGKRF